MHRSLSTAAALTAASLLIAAAAPAQTVTGTVQSAGSPVVGAMVRLTALDRAVRTGAAGRFSFSNVPKGEYKLFASAPGYAPATRTVDVASGTATVSFDLEPSPVQLNELVITASPFARAANEQYQSAESKSQTEFLNGAGASVAEKISDIPGVSVRGNGSAPSRPILRGLGDNEVLVLENGLRTGDIATYDPAHATPIEAIGVSRVDVVRGPATILYGPSTIGGLVNVITDIVPTVSDRPLSGTVAAEGNSVSDLYSGYFNNVFSGANQAFRVSAGLVRSQDIHIPAGTYTDPGTGAQFNLDRMPQTFSHSGEAGLGYVYQRTAGSIGIGAKHYEMNYGIPGVPPNPDWMNVPPTTSRIAQKRNTVEMRGLLGMGNGFVKQLKLDANFNDYAHAEFPTAQDSTGVSDPEANHFHKRQFNGVLQFQQRRHGKLQGVLGLWTNVENLTIGGDQPLGPNSLTTDFAGYAYEEYLATDATRLQAGLRYDYAKITTNPDAQSADSVFRTLRASRLANAVTASMGAIQQFSREITGSLSVARSFRAPTVQELFANGLDAASGTYSVGSANLGPEAGLGIDASLRGEFARASFELSPYLNSIDHYIYAYLRGDTIQGFPVRQFAASRAQLMGFEASVTAQPMERVALTASSDYVYAENTDQHVPLPFIPPLRGLLRAMYQGPIYMGVVEWRGAASQTRLGDGDTPTAGYGIMNLGAGLRLVRRARVHDVSIHVDNVFDRVYRDNLSVIKDFVPQPGRAIRLNYELTY